VYLVPTLALKPLENCSKERVSCFRGGLVGLSMMIVCGADEDCPPGLPSWALASSVTCSRKGNEKAQAATKAADSLMPLREYFNRIC
jgi:hypothetical protein